MINILQSDLEAARPIPPFAVLFLTHFWNEFSDRQIARLMQVSGHADVFVVVDESRGPVLVRHPPTHVLFITTPSLAEDGFLLEPRDQARWLHTDYNLYHFIERYPQYDYVFLVEHDCVVTANLDVIVGAMKLMDAEFVGLPMSGAVEHWYWTETAIQYYDHAVISGRLMGITAYSRSLAERLSSERRSSRLRERFETFRTTVGSQIKWLNNECFIGCELTRLGILELSLSDFGDTSRYDWFPPTMERDLTRMSEPAFIHPCLDDKTVAASFVKRGWRPAGNTNRGVEPWPHLQSLTDQSLVDLFARHFIAIDDRAGLNDLYAFCLSHSRNEVLLEIDVGLGRPATQSSVGQWSIHSNPSHEASRAVDGSIVSHAVHTDFEESAWWCLDLQRQYPISEIRIVLVMDPGEKPVEIAIVNSSDLMDWSELPNKQACLKFASGLAIATYLLSPPITTRFLRVTRCTPGHLRLNAVKVLFAGSVARDDIVI